MSFVTDIDSLFKMSDVSDNKNPNLGSQSSPKHGKTKSFVWEHFTKESLAAGCTKARCKYCNQQFAYSNGSKSSGTSHLKRHLTMGACPEFQNQDRNQLLLSFSRTPTEPPSSPRRRKTKSIVWEHFNVESLTNGSSKARCKHCNQMFTYDSRITGTSHLKRHLTFERCSKYQHKEKNEQLLPFTPITPDEGSSILSTMNFDQGHSRQDLAKMIILHDYPFQMVEHSAFINFVLNLQPHFKMVTCNTIKDDCLAIYEKEKQNLRQLLRTVPGQISLTLNTWMFDEAVVYMFLTGHFIDRDWKFHRHILNFKLVSSLHTRNTLIDLVDACLLDWNIEKRLLAFTTDDCSMNDIHTTNLRYPLTNKNTVLLNVRLLYVRSFAQIINLVVQDGLELIPEIICKIRESIKYIKGSQLHEQKFAEIVQQLRITSDKSLSLDIQPRWDTTYQMLEAALELKYAFSRLDYDKAPSMDDWDKVEALCMYLKIFYDATNVFSKTALPTSNLYFLEAWKIQVELGHALASPNAFVRAMMKHMQPKFDQYWKDNCLVLALGVILDPRFKMKFVEFIFSKIYGKNADRHISIVDEHMHNLFMEYGVAPHSISANLEDVSADNVGVENILCSSSDGLQEFDQFISKTFSSEETKSELDQYLEEPLVPRRQDFDILTWWKMNTPKYLILSKIARNILAIPMSTVDSSSIFSTKSRVLDPHHNSLPPETLEAMICAQDWLCNASMDSS